jgi:hypothetical protein
MRGKFGARLALKRSCERVASGGLLAVSLAGCSHDSTPQGAHSPAPSPIAGSAASAMPVPSSNLAVTPDSPAVTLSPTPVPSTAEGAPGGKPCLDERALAPAAAVVFESAACLVRVASAAALNVSVAIAGGGELRIHVVHAPVEIVPPEAIGQAAAIRVNGSVQFLGSVRINAFSVTKPVDLVPGIARGGPRTRISQAHAAGQELLGVAEVGDSRIENARVICSALGLWNSESRWARELGIAQAKRWSPLENSFRLRAEPDQGAEALVTGFPVFAQLAVQRGWAHLSARYDDGSSISGWADEHSIRRLSKEEGAGEIGHGIALCATGELCQPDRAVPGTRAGVASVPAGTLVFSSPQGSRWAVTSRAISVRAIESPGVAWLQLAELPGIEEHEGCGRVDHAYVAASAVEFRVDSTKR